MECVIARHINGISLNELEFVLNGSGDVKSFPDKDEAINFLYKEGVPQDEIDYLMFFKYPEIKEGIYEEI